MASVMMPYHMMGMAGMGEQVLAQPQDMLMTDHSNHNITSGAVDNTAESTEDCCTQVCNCFMGGCSSFAAFMKDMSGDTPINDVSPKILSYSTLALSQQAKSLYRPPILS